MTDLRKAAEMALEALEDVFDLEKKDVAAIQALRQALAQEEKPPVKSYCGGKPNYCTPVDAVNMSQEHLEEPANSTTDFVEPKVSSQTEQKPLVWMNKYGHVASFQNEEYKDPLYTAPPKKEWVGLTEDEFEKILETHNQATTFAVYLSIEAKLKQKNT